jgi:putative ABC transport system permease protein
VQDVSATSTLPFPGRGSSWTIRIQRGAEEFALTCWARETDPTYTRTLRIPLLSGRHLSEADDRNAPTAALVSESLAEQLWPNEPALGQTLRANGLDRTVVGVVGDVRQEALGLDVQPALYLPIAQTNVRRRAMTLAVRTASSDPLTTLAALRDAIWSLDPDIVISEPNTMRNLIRASESDDRFRALLMWTFASIAAVLAAVGIFGVTARAVSARAKEMAIRSALGAEANGLIGLVLTDGLLSVALGLACGLVAALWASKLIGHLLFEVDARDPWTFAGAVVLSITVCIVAAYVPARRVTKIEPMEMLAEN